MNAPDFLVGGGLIGVAMRTHDWSTSPLGPLETWPLPLRAALTIMLNSAVPAYLAWGQDLISFYNDAYRPLLGMKPEALGRPFPQVWAEIWDDIGPIVARAMSGEASYYNDLPLTVQRKGYAEETWWTFSCSPIRDETGGVGGVLCFVLEITDRVLTERRLRFLIDLGNRLRGLTDAREVMAIAAERLGRHLKAGRAGYGEVDGTGAFFTVEFDWTDGAMPSFAGRHRLDEFGSSIIAELRAGRAVRIDDTLADPCTAGEDKAAAFAATGMHTGIWAPLIKGGRMAAALYAHQALPRRWRDDELTLLQDVAERTWEAVSWARAEAALRESEERLRHFAEHSPNVLWIKGVESNALEYLSPAFERVWGEPRDAMLRDPSRWIGSVHRDDQVGARNALKRVMRGEVVVEEYRIVRADGSVRRIRDTVFPIRGEGGQLRRVGGIAQDITCPDEVPVYVVDADEASRKGRVLLLRDAGYRVRAFASAQEILEVAPVLMPGCVLLARPSEHDAARGTDGLVRALSPYRKSLPVIVMAADEHSADVASAVRVMKAGAVDFLEAPVDRDQILAAVASAFAEIRNAAERDQAVAVARRRIAAMTGRERAVLEGLLAGGTNKTIARHLGLSPRTVEIYRARVMKRLNARTLPEAVLIAAAAGLKPPPEPA